MYICPGIQPYALSEPIRNLSVVNLNYTNQDFWSMKGRLVQFIKERFADDFNDFVESSIAIMLIENFAFIADTLSFKMDQIANEIFIDTVTELDNAFRLSKLVGFQPTPPIAARNLWTATIQEMIGQDLRIPAPYDITIPADDGTIIYELFPADAYNNVIYDEDIIISAGELQATNIIGLQGHTQEITFQGTGAVSQFFTLLNPNILLDSIRVYVEGVQWQRVDYFTDSQPRREYIVEYESDYSAYIIFGNNRAGLIPPLGSNIQVIYRIGDGVRGNIISTIITQGSQAVDYYPYNMVVTFSNYTKGEFGYDGDTIEDIRRKLPEYLRTQDRAVTGLDYKTLADHFATAYHGQIGKSVAALRNYGCAANIVDLFVLAKENESGLTEASDELKVDLQEFLDSRKMITDEVCIKNGIVLETDIYIDLSVNRLYKKFEDDIRTRVVKRLDMYFNLVNWEYGQNLKDSDIIKVLSDIREITDFSTTFTTNDPQNNGTTITTKYYEIIRPYTVDVSFTYF